MLSDTICELNQLRAEILTGVQVLADAERKWLELDSEAGKVEARAILEAQGTALDRQAVAKLKAADAKFQADLAKAELNRVRQKIKALETSLMALQSVAKLQETELKTLR